MRYWGIREPKGVRFFFLHDGMRDADTETLGIEGRSPASQAGDLPVVQWIQLNHWQVCVVCVVYPLDH